jgi:hypothetical protein
MKKQYDNTNSGIVSKNKRKEKDTHPDITGSINVEGREYWLSGWQKQGQSGTFYSLSVKPKDQQAVPINAQKFQAPVGHQDDEDSIPF